MNSIIIEVLIQFSGEYGNGIRRVNVRSQASIRLVSLDQWFTSSEPNPKDPTTQDLLGLSIPSPSASHSPPCAHCTCCRFPLPVCSRSISFCLVPARTSLLHSRSCVGCRLCALLSFVYFCCGRLIICA
jgi:hypothetical protein